MSHGLPNTLYQHQRHVTSAGHCDWLEVGWHNQESAALPEVLNF